ncbi:ATP-binding protein [Nocardioides sp. URHA0020]|uniref:ATP-binding protein n=1 Tax=Nocardioides sp. URHA0020 TaxID=1380392 RepID=UPI000685F6A7|nr:ATP-binding protein [Nocardioides sp. URHA0020]
MWKLGRGRLAVSEAVLILGVVFGAGVLAIVSEPDGSPVAIWWPAAGISVALLALTPHRWWWWLVPALVVVTGAANLVEDRPLDLCVWLAVANTSEAVVAAAFLRWRRDELPELASLDVFVRLVIGAVLGGLTMAVLAAAGILVLTDGSVPEAFRSLTLSHAASTLVVLPIVMAPPLRRRRRVLWQRAELPVQLVALTVVTTFVFVSGQTRSLEFLPLPLLIWAALRFDVAIVAWELAGVSIIVIVASSQGQGPFGFDFERGQVSALGLGAVLQAFVVVCALMTLPLAIGVEQNRRLLGRLGDSEKLTSATLDTTAALILVTDLRGQVVRVNGATTTLTGFPESDLLGHDIWDMPFAPAGSTGYPAGLPTDPHAQASRETNLATRTGERRRVLWNTSYVLDDQERPAYVVLTGTDLTAERTAAGLTRHLLESAVTTAMIGIDPQGRITVFNAGAVNLLGYDGQDIVGTAFVDLLDPAQVAQRCGGLTGEDAFPRLVTATSAAGATPLRDWVWIGSDGRRHTVSMTLSVAADTFAAEIGYLCVGRDVTEARASQEMLIAALEKERLAVQRMKELDEAKNEFVSTVSHELRTPVTSIVGYTEMLEDGTLVDPSPEQVPLLASIARNGQRLILLCDDLLTLSGMDSGATRWERNAVDLSAIVTGADDALRAQLAGRDLDVVVMSSDSPIPVLGDRRQLERALMNLLSNAIKFTEDGGRIEVSAKVHDGEAWLSVADTGIGVPVEEQARLFERFFRSTSAQQRAIQGTGLGLSIVAAIVATHGGQIDVRSAHLEGTTVTIRLPLARG